MRIGRIAYLNVAPYFHYLSQRDEDEIVTGVPSELNRLLFESQIDVCPSSSFEYGLHADQYLILPNHSISSIGPVHSVLLFANQPLSMLSGAEIVVTGESATSINLLHILLREFCHVEDVVFRVSDRPVEGHLKRGDNLLLIGDRALAAAQSNPQAHQITDLGALWHHFTGLPFVFALWILRREFAQQNPEAVNGLLNNLEASRHRAFENLEEMAAAMDDNAVLSVAQMQQYWRGMSYELTDGHLEGLRLYFALCQKYDLLEQIPELQFFAAT
ncbi:MAG: menaquinone biosynthesis protein [Desulfuromonadales bacterium]|nr:menaquinone biosynthesis protein [Desulfuromonadales bacterium]